MKLLIDMNLPPRWVEFLDHYGWEAVHWSHVGDPRATDHTILEWARAENHIVFTHDLDFGAILAVTNADSPSVLQVRTHEVLPENLGKLVVDALEQFREMLERGALITVDESTARARILPLKD